MRDAVACCFLSVRSSLLQEIFKFWQFRPQNLFYELNVDDRVRVPPIWTTHNAVLSKRSISLISQFASTIQFF